MKITKKMIEQATIMSSLDQLKTYEKGCKIEVLEWLLKNASGGGSWRRLCVMKIAELRNAS